MRPSSHRYQYFDKRCGTCRHSRDSMRDDCALLCLLGDKFEDRGNDVFINGNYVSMMGGDEYDRIWGGRAVEDSDVCDEWAGVS